MALGTRARSHGKGRTSEKPSAELALAGLLDTIRQGFFARRDGDKKRSPYDRAMGFLKREVYRTVREHLEMRRGGVISQLLANEGHKPSRGDLRENLFHMLLVLLFDDVTMSRSEKRRIANELAYARLHRVPDDYLIGFLLQTAAGGSIYRRVRDNTREPWFDEDRAERIQEAALSPQNPGV